MYFLHTGTPGRHTERERGREVGVEKDTKTDRSTARQQEEEEKISHQIVLLVNRG